VHKISRQYANKLIRAGEIRIEMETIVSKLGLPEPANEAQLRDPGDRKQAYIDAVEVSKVEERTVTARDIQTAADKRRQTDQAGQKRSPSPTARLLRAGAVLDELEEALAQGRDPAGLVKKLRKLLGG